MRLATFIAPDLLAPRVGVVEGETLCAGKPTGSSGPITVWGLVK